MRDSDVRPLTTLTVSRLVGVPESTLKHWESYYELNIGRDDHGHRVYRPGDVTVLFFIKRKLRDEMLSPRAVRDLLKNETP